MKELAKNMINPFSYTDRALQVGFNIALDNHHDNQTNSKLTNKANNSENEIRFVNKRLKEMATFYDRKKIEINLKIKQYFQRDLINKMKMDRY